MEKDIEFRYIKSGTAYLPQFKQPAFGDEWRYFSGKTFGEKSLLGNLCIALSGLSPKTSRGYRYLLENEDGAEYVYFAEEHLVMAFIGGATSYYSKQTVEVNL